MCVVFHCDGNVHIRVPVGCLSLVAEDSVSVLHDQGREDVVDQAENICAGVHVKLF